MPGRYRRAQAEAAWADQRAFLTEVLAPGYDRTTRVQRYAADIAADYYQLLSYDEQLRITQQTVLNRQDDVTTTTTSTCGRLRPMWTAGREPSERCAGAVDQKPCLVSGISSSGFSSSSMLSRR